MSALQAIILTITPAIIGIALMIYWLIEVTMLDKNGNKLRFCNTCRQHYTEDKVQKKKRRNTIIYTCLGCVELIKNRTKSGN